MKGTMLGTLEESLFTSLVLEAENDRDLETFRALGRKLRPVDLAERGLDIDPENKGYFVLPLEHLVAKKTEVVAGPDHTRS